MLVSVDSTLFDPTATSSPLLPTITRNGTDVSFSYCRNSTETLPEMGFLQMR